MMGRGRLAASPCYLLFLWALLTAFCGASAVRFTLDQFECLTYYVHYVGDEVHGNFVVVSSQTWGEWESLGVDIVVEDPDGYHVHSSQGQTDGVFSFESMREGDYKVCFTNKSPINEEIVFELHVGHHFSEKELAKEGGDYKGDYKVCFTNKSPINEEIVFELHMGHHFSEKELAKEEHVEQTRDKAKNLYERVMVLSMQAKFRHSQAQRLNEYLPIRSNIPPPSLPPTPPLAPALLFPTSSPSRPAPSPVSQLSRPAPSPISQLSRPALPPSPPPCTLPFTPPPCLCAPGPSPNCSGQVHTTTGTLILKTPRFLMHPLNLSSTSPPPLSLLSTSFPHSQWPPQEGWPTRPPQQARLIFKTPSLLMCPTFPPPPPVPLAFPSTPFHPPCFHAQWPRPPQHGSSSHTTAPPSSPPPYPLAKTTTARLIFKTAIQSGALILCSSIQVYLLHRLFERKLGRSFV
ncbi:unnamed protein product [Closterium sp. Naga37s-1]|nr:unnamed protein product [Closterium sp. Naga37s-1]